MISKLLATGAFIASTALPETEARESLLDSLKIKTPKVERMSIGVNLRCTTTIDRLKQGPADWKAYIEANNTRRGGYRDRSFSGTDQYYNLPWSGWSAWEDYWMYGFNYYFERLGEKYPNAKLFGNSGVP